MILALLAAACFGALDRAPPDAAIATRIERVRIEDSRGNERPPDDVPSDARFVVESSAELASRGVYVVAGEVDDAALRSRALAASERRRLVPARIEPGDRGLRIVPESPLDPGGVYTVLVTREAKGALGDDVEGTPLAVSVQIAPAAEFRVLSTFPASGTPVVPRGLDRVLVQLVGPVPVKAVWNAPRGEIPIVSAQQDCAELGFSGGACLAIVPQRRLDPGRHLVRITSGIGAVGPPYELSFQVAGGDAAELAFTTVECAADEIATALGCALLTDERIAIHTHVDRPARVFFALDGVEGAKTIASRGDITLAIDELTGDRAYIATLRVVELDGSETLREAELATRAAMLPLYVSRVVGNPAGPEPTQEAIELYHDGDRWLSLIGLTLVDDPMSMSEPFTAPVSVPPHGFVVLVADGFDENVDWIAPGAQIVRWGRTLTPSGLRNGGERVILRDADGARLSEAPATALAEGACLERSRGGGRDGDAASFEVRETCTLGLGAWLEGAR